MADVHFTPHLALHLSCPSTRVEGETVRRVLENVFRDNPPLRGYVVDEHFRLRQHVVVFVDGEMIRDRIGLGDAVSATSELYVMQALSGG